LADVASFFTVEDFEEPICKRYKTNEANEASLGAILVENPNGVLVVRDEIVALFRNFDSEHKAGEREFFLTGWNGNSPHTIDRIVRGKNLHIPGVCISLLGTTQPGKIARYVSEAVRGGYGDDGMLQRMQFMVWPDIPPDWQDIDRPINKAVKHRAFDVYKRLDELDPIAIGAAQDLDYDGEPEGLPYLRWTPAALEIFRDWHKRLQLRIRGDIHPAMEAHLGKYSKLVPSVALICHLADGKTGNIGEEEVLRPWLSRWLPRLRRYIKRLQSAHLRFACSSRITAPTTSAMIRGRSARNSATLSSMRSTAFAILASLSSMPFILGNMWRETVRSPSTSFSSKAFVAHVLNLPSKAWG
jgi:putative DNA primase/helicase